MAFDHGLVTKFTTLGVAAATLGVAVWGFFTDFHIETIMNCINLMYLLFHKIALFLWYCSRMNLKLNLSEKDLPSLTIYLEEAYILFCMHFINLALVHGFMLCMVILQEIVV
jgi:hypothetical protein